MSLLTHPATIALRNLARAAGLTRPIAMLRAGKSYEEGVDRTLLSAVRAGDVVWDVGANVGHYSVRLAALESVGKVFAFEPSPANLAKLRSAASGYANLTIVPIGLSARPGRVNFVQGADDLGATSRVLRPDQRAGARDETFEVELCRGDDLIASGAVAAPNIVKIDVEGHEHEVLEGLSATIEDARLRLILIEVHFSLLAAAGRADVPGAVERRLKKEGFLIRWIDASHLLASRADRDQG